MTETISQNGALVLCGKIGLPQYLSQAQAVQGPASKIGSRTIKFWAPEALKPVEEDSALHDIIVIGTQKISTGDVHEEYVLFLDPNDASTPGQEREVYRMSYANLIQRIATHTSVEFTSPEFIPDDPESVYAISARFP